MFSALRAGHVGFAGSLLAEIHEFETVWQRKNNKVKTKS